MRMYAIRRTFSIAICACASCGARMAFGARYRYIGGMSGIAADRGVVGVVTAAGGAARPLARALGLSPSTVQDWLSGRKPVPPQHLDALADVLGLDARRLHRLAARERGYRV